jgi:RIO kinase 2
MVIIYFLNLFIKKNHELVPTPLIERIASLRFIIYNIRHGGCKKRLNNLLRNKLVHHDSKICN